MVASHFRRSLSYLSSGLRSGNEKIVVLAPKGQVGFELVRALSPIGEVLTIGRQEVDFSHLDKLSERLLAIKPDVIVNAAAYTAVRC